MRKNCRARGENRSQLCNKRERARGTLNRSERAGSDTYCIIRHKSPTPLSEKKSQNLTEQFGKPDTTNFSDVLLGFSKSCARFVGVKKVFWFPKARYGRHNSTLRGHFRAFFSRLLFARTPKTQVFCRKKWKNRAFMPKKLK